MNARAVVAAIVSSRTAAALACVMVSGCSPASSGGDAALLVGRAADAIRLDPARITDVESAEVTEQIYEHLVRFKAETEEIEPALATSWDDVGGREWTFHLRSNVRFHDDQPFDADAVVFSFERQRNPLHPFHVDDFTYESLFKDIVRVEKVDALTVRIVLRASYAPFLANLAMFPMSIVSPKAAARWGAHFDEHPTGTGPFRFVGWSRGDRITLAANPSYWGGPPDLRQLAFVTVADPRQRLVKLEGGAIDVAENLAPQDLQFVALHPALFTRRSPGHNVAYLAMNTGHAPFDDVRVRRAVQLAIDKTAIVKLVYQGLAQVATGPLPPKIWGKLARAVEPADPARARALLVAAGWDSKRRPTLYLPSNPRPYMPAPERVARMIAQNLHEVGMEVKLVINPMNVHLAETSRGAHDLCLLGWTSDNGDPDNFLYTLFHGENAHLGTASNVSFLADPELDGLLRAGQETLDHKARETLYRRVQEIVFDRAAVIPIAHSDIVLALRRTVDLRDLPPTGIVIYQHVTRVRP